MIKKKSIPSVTVSAGKGKYRICAEVKNVGSDIVVIVWGGTHPHVGSVVVAIPRASHENVKKVSSTSSSFNFSGHKDDAVAKIIAEAIASALNKNTICTAGIHIDAITETGLKKIMQNTDRLSTILIRTLSLM